MGLFSSVFGDDASIKLNQAEDVYRNIDLPDIEKMKLQLQQYVDQGMMTPEEAEAQLVGSNGYDSMDLDSSGKAAQMAALQGLQEIGNQGGLTSSDKAKLQEIQNQEQTSARGSREAILQNANARGAGGSGLEMLAQLQNAQDSATRASSRDLNVSAQAQDRALQALQQAGQMGGNINQQQFGQQAAVADSRNAISQFNAANRQQVNSNNTAINNNAMQTNLQNKQNTANANVDTQNKQQQYNSQLPQQQFQNEMTKAGGITGISRSAADQASSDANSEKNLWGAVVGAGATLFSDERAKKDIKEFNAADFLDSLTGYKYKYKDESMGDGKQVGVMAQDLEKEVPQMVADTPRGKVVDYNKAGGPIMASLAHLNERLKKMEGR